MFKKDAENKTNHQAWAQKLEAGAQDEPTVQLAAQLQAELPAAVTMAPAFKRKLRQDLLQQYEPKRALWPQFHLPRLVGTAVFLSLITIGIVTVWMAMRTTASNVPAAMSPTQQASDPLAPYAPLGDSGLYVGYVSTDEGSKLSLFNEPAGVEAGSVERGSPLLLTGETAVIENQLWLQIRHAAANDKTTAPDFWAVAAEINPEPAEGSDPLPLFRENDQEIAYLWSAQQLSKHTSGDTMPNFPLLGSETQIEITWLWLQPTTDELMQSIQLLDAEGNLVTSWDTAVERPTTSQTGELQLTSQTITLPDTLPGGTYNSQIILYNAQTGQRLLTDSGDNAIQTASLTVYPADVDQVWIESISLSTEQATPGKLSYEVIVGVNLVSAPEGVLKLHLAHPEWETKANPGTRVLMDGVTDFIPVTAKDRLITLSFTVDKAVKRQILQTEQPVLVALLGAHREQELEVFAMPTFATETMFDLSQ